MENKTITISSSRNNRVILLLPQWISLIISFLTRIWYLLSHDIQLSIHDLNVHLEISQF